MDFAKTGAGAIKEISACVDAIDPNEVAALADLISGAKRIALYGVGREGLMIRGLAMRLYHLGLDAHVVGDMSTPPVGPGDLLIVSAGPGMFSTVAGLVGVAGKAGATTACLTAQPNAELPGICDKTLVLPAQTMASDSGADTSILPMGSLYEGVMFLACELLVLMLAEQLEISAGAMRARHTNLE
ncbi:MAG: SIS domain-containing protein [Rhodobacteraceae bacterium]|nr:SIS domain-containing protein [Paracoccaceae bacterium]